ncbi:hypothetical protein C8R42DRAFT_716325 [Lentinula raphanica]|nr:hypothetical protein C8R42DRAFT_716325 [Lentinula raphanica]
MSPPSVFPPEIYDKIIDEVSSSKEALSACSLVERSWIPRSRSHMFRDINFTTPESTETTRTKQRQLTPGGSRHTDAFQQHVASNADVASYARRLVLTLTSSGNIASDIPQASELLNLHSLTLRCSNIIIYAVNDAVLTRLLSFIRHNQHLEYIALYSLVIDPSAFDVFIKCISIRAPRLQSLHLHSVWGPDWTRTAGWSQRGGRLSQSTHHHRVRSLTKLCVSHCESGAISTFLAAFDLQSLERLALINLDWDTCMSLVVASSSSTTLAHCTLDLSNLRRLPSDIFTYLAKVHTVQLVLKHFSDASNVLQQLRRAAYQRALTLKRLHLQFRRYPIPSDPMIDSAVRELEDDFRLRVSIGFEKTEGTSGTYGLATDKIGAAVFMGRTNIESMDAWWIHEAERY